MVDNQTQNTTSVNTGVAVANQPVVSDSNNVFNKTEKDVVATPEWLKESSDSIVKTQKDDVVKIPSSPTEVKGNDVPQNVLPDFRSDKPTAVELGADPASFVGILPDIELVRKADEEAKVKMRGAGYDPFTGKKLTPEDIKKQEEKKAEEASLDAPKKKTPLDMLKQLFGFGKKEEKQIVTKVDNLEKVQDKQSALDKLKSLFVFSKKADSVSDNATKSVTGDTKPALSSADEERKKFLEAEKIYQEGLVYIKDLIAPSAMEINYDSIRIDGMYAKSFYVFSYPRYLDVNWMSPIVNFDVTMDISQFIYPISSAEIMKTLKKKVAQMQSTIRMNAEKGMVRDPAVETALEDAETLRTEIQRGQEKFFQFALYFTIYSEDDKNLEKVAKQLESLLAGKLVMTKRTQVQSEHGFNAAIPLGLDELYVIRNMNTSPLSTTFPFTSSDLTSDRGVLYGLNRHNDSLIIFDRFALENANSVVLAKSGAGKSYLVKLEILRMMMMGTDVIVIDPENEYEALANTVGGSYLKISLNSDRRINPFDLPNPIAGDDVQPGDLLRNNIINLHGLLKLMMGDVTPEEDSILDKALIDVYALKGITMDVTDPSKYEPPTMEDLYQILSSMDGAQSLTQKLSKYTTGSYSGVFNKPTNVDLTSGLMVFCIRDLEDALRPIAMFIILNYIWNQVRSKLKKRILVVDEAWTMMQHEDSAKFLFGLVKRARKYYLGVTTITQDVEDFILSPFGRPIITNSSMQHLLKQSPSAVEVLAKIFNLTEGEKYVLLNSGVGQGLFFAGTKHVAMQVIASYIEDRIVTTNPEEILARNQAAAAESSENSSEQAA